MRVRPSAPATLPAFRAWRVLALAGALSLLVAGCGGGSTKTPENAARAYGEALASGRVDDAYGLLAAETRAELSREDFERLLREHPEEVAALVETLEGKVAGAEIRAIVIARSGERITLVYEGGAWKLDASAVVLYPQDTPRNALASFVRAYDAGRFDVLLRFVPQAELEGLSQEVLEKSFRGEQREEMDAIVEGLRVSLDAAQIEQLGDRATMSYGTGAAELVREDGAWKIEDFR